jgi:hypothetical protein
MNEAQSIAAADASIYLALTGRRPVLKTNPEPRRGARGLLQHKWMPRTTRDLMKRLKGTTAFTE